MISSNEKFKIFSDELLKWNRIHKLTNYKNEKEIFEQIEDSIYPIKYIENVKTIMDIGTGAGFPGLLLGFALPEVKVYLVEPLQKRFSFLNYMKMMTQSNNIEIVPKRVENIEPFEVDLITSRAVSDTKLLIELSNNFISTDTKLLLYKGENAQNEVEGLNAEIYPNGKRNYVILRNII
jgi:16S rRNA (guanine527-N7)-methyltransferase